LLDLLAKLPEAQAGLAPPLRGEKQRVADVVPALEDAIALVLAAPANAAPRAPAPAQETLPPALAHAPPSERGRRVGQLVAEYRQLRQSLNNLQFNELALINRARMLQLMQGAGAAPAAQDHLQQIQKELDELGTRKAEVVKRMNQLDAEYRQLQESPS
jgi:hypothetical protein